MKRLVVNADDFGLTEGTNQGILEAHERGILTSTTLMANATAFDSAVELARRSPRLGVGVHLSLTGDRPVCDPTAVPSVVGDDGRFFRGPVELAQRMFAHKVHLAEVERELAAQIEKARRAGIEVTHLDGHKHVHMLPGVFPIVVRLARQYHIPGVRVAVERPMGLGPLLRRHPDARIAVVKQYLRARALALLGMDRREQLRKAGIACPGYFYGVTQTGFLDGAELEAILWDLPEGTSELMCHPGRADGALRETGTRLVAQRVRELEALTRPETRNLVTALGIQLINYRGLAKV